MTVGYSGSYGVNGVNFTLQPTSGKWVKREEYGVDGGGHPIYPSVREFELKWNLMHPTDFTNVMNAYETVSNTGTVSFDLPDYRNANFLFKTYTGCTMEEPEVGEYFQGYITDVSVTLLKVTT